MFRDELFDFRWEGEGREWDFPRTVLCRVDEWRGGGRGWKKLLRSLVNESDVYCAMRAREREKKKKETREKNFENIGKKVVGKMVFDRDCVDARDARAF